MSNRLKEFLMNVSTGRFPGNLSKRQQTMLDYFKADPLHSSLLFTAHNTLLYNGFGEFQTDKYEGSDLEWLVDHGYLIIMNNQVRAEFDIEKLKEEAMKKD